MASVHIIGFAKVVGEIADGAAQVLLFFALAVVITALFVYAYTRSVRLTAMPLACSLVAVVWQLGALTALGFGVDPMSILVPFLVFAIGVSHGVQMVNAVQAGRGRRRLAPRGRASAACCCRAPWRWRPTPSGSWPSRSSPCGSSRRSPSPPAWAWPRSS